MREIEIEEWGKSNPESLNVDEVHNLEKTEYFILEPVADKKFLIRPREGVVGIISPSPALTVFVRPRWPCASVLKLAAYAYGVDTALAVPLPARLAWGGALDWLALLLVLEVERLLAHGIRYGYHETFEEVQQVRGRIAFHRLNPRHEAQAVLPCLFTDFSPSTLENRIIRGCLEIVDRFPLSPELHAKVQSALSAFRTVQPVYPSPQLFERVHLHRLNAHYEGVLRICRMIAEGIGVELSPGSVPSPSLFIKMSDLFERGVERALREAVLEHHAQPRYTKFLVCRGNGEAKGLEFVPDNVLGPKEAPQLVVDAKYKDPSTWHSVDLYQALIYAASLRARTVLVYPQVDTPIRVSVEWQGLGARVDVVTVDLSTDPIQALRTFGREMRRLLEEQPNYN
ncbi:MAG: hypothetical protein QW562_07340 [Thermosphaera sp.]